MQTVGTVSSLSTRYPDHRRRPKGHQPGSGAKRKNCSPERGCNDFLKATIGPAYPKSIICEGIHGDRNLLTQANYDYLSASAENYAGLLGKSLEFSAGDDLCNNISTLYDALAALLPEHQYLNIDTCRSGLAFCVYQEHQWYSYTFYWLPIRFIDSLQGKLKRIAITFIHNFARSNNIPFLYQSNEIDYLLEMFGEGLTESGWNKEDHMKDTKLFHSYSAGHILRLQRSVAKRSYYKRLAAALERYEPQEGREAKLVTLMRSGLQFIGEDKPSIMSYQYAPEFDPGGEMIVPLDSIVRIIYDYNDWIGEALEDSVNCEIQNNDSMTPTLTCFLSPQTTELFVKDDYPERFFDWFMDFTKLIDSEYDE